MQEMLLPTSYLRGRGLATRCGLVTTAASPAAPRDWRSDTSLPKRPVAARSVSSAMATAFGSTSLGARSRSRSQSINASVHSVSPEHVTTLPDGVVNRTANGGEPQKWLTSNTSIDARPRLTTRPGPSATNRASTWSSARCEPGNNTSIVARSDSPDQRVQGATTAQLAYCSTAHQAGRREDHRSGPMEMTHDHGRDRRRINTRGLQPDQTRSAAVEEATPVAVLHEHADL